MARSLVNRAYCSPSDGSIRPYWTWPKRASVASTDDDIESREVPSGKNPDILAALGKHPKRPTLLIGFAAETENLLANASTKLKRKGADWIVANDVSPGTGVMGGANNRVHLLSAAGIEDWPEMSKQAVAKKLAERIASHLLSP